MLTRGYQGINFIILNRGPAVSQTVNFNWYYGNKSNGQQWVWQVLHPCCRLRPRACGSERILAGAMVHRVGQQHMSWRDASRHACLFDSSECLHNLSSLRAVSIAAMPVAQPSISALLRTTVVKSLARAWGP